MQLSIRRKMVITCILFAFVPLFIAGIFISIETRIDIINQARSLERERALRLKEQTEFYIRSFIDEINIITRTTGFSSYNTETQKEMLNELLAYSGSFNELSLLNRYGREIIKSSRTEHINENNLEDQSLSEPFLYVKEFQDEYYGSMQFDDQTGEPFMKIALPVMNPERTEMEYVITGVVRMYQVWLFFREMVILPGQVVYMMDSENRIIAHRNPSLVLRGSQAGFDIEAEIRQGLEADRVISSSEALIMGNQKFYIVSEFDIGYVNDHFYKHILIIISILVFTTIISFLVIIRIVKSFIRPIDLLIEAQERIKSGEFSVQVSLPGKDEFGILGESFNTMSKTLEKSRKHLENEILERKESERKFRYIAENVEEVFWIGSADWQKILYISPAFEQVWGLSCKALYENAQIWMESIFPEDRAGPEEIIAHASQDFSKPVVFPEYRICDTEGNTRWISARAFFIFDDSRDDHIVVGIAQDITKRKENELKLIQANRTKQDFLANMSHEMRTPLNGVMGMTSLLMHQNLTNDQKELLRMVQHSAGNMQHIVEDLLDLAKIDAGKLLIQPETFDMKDLIETTVKSVSHQAALKELKVETRFEDQGDSSYFGDKTRIGQILINLLTNAIKYTDSGKILVECALNSRLTISVRDTGIGIAEDKLSCIFENFTQLEDTYNKTQQGLGLGLSIVKHIVDLLHGEISVESTPGDGSSFTVTLPAVKAEEDKPEPKDKSEISLSDIKEVFKQRSLRLLLIEDEAINRMYMKQFMEEYGFEVEEASDGEKALQMYQEGSYHLLLMDVGLPRLNGIETTKRIREMEAGKDNRVPIIALTAHAHKEDYQNCLSAGMDDVALKPVNESDLLRKIYRFISR